MTHDFAQRRICERQLAANHQQRSCVPDRKIDQVADSPLVGAGAYPVEQRARLSRVKQQIVSVQCEKRETEFAKGSRVACSSKYPAARPGCAEKKRGNPANGCTAPLSCDIIHHQGATLAAEQAKGIRNNFEFSPGYLRAIEGRPIERHGK